MFEISSKCKGIVIKHSVDAWFVLYIRMLIKILCGFLHVYRTQDKKKIRPMQTKEASHTSNRNLLPVLLPARPAARVYAAGLGD